MTRFVEAFIDMAILLFTYLCCDLLQTQLGESELQRQETLQQLQNLTEKLGEFENKMKAKEQEMKDKNEELQTVNLALSDLEKKYKHEVFTLIYALL